MATSSLHERLLLTDTSIKNPVIQQIIERELVEWVQHYEHNKEYVVYGRIPDTIKFEKQTLSPYDVLDHVRTRDTLGLEIMTKINEHHQAAPMSQMLNELRHFNLKSIDLDAPIIFSSSKSYSTRQILDDFANSNPHSLILNVGWSESIAMLYGKRM
jgi:hypothetical protein